MVSELVLETQKIKTGRGWQPITATPTLVLHLRIKQEWWKQQWWLNGGKRNVTLVPKGQNYFAEFKIASTYIPCWPVDVTWDAGHIGAAGGVTRIVWVMKEGGGSVTFQPRARTPAHLHFFFLLTPQVHALLKHALRVYVQHTHTHILCGLFNESRLILSVFPACEDLQWHLRWTSFSLSSFFKCLLSQFICRLSGCLVGLHRRRKCSFVCEWIVLLASKWWIK